MPAGHLFLVFRLEFFNQNTLTVNSIYGIMKDTNECLTRWYECRILIVGTGNRISRKRSPGIPLPAPMIRKRISGIFRPFTKEPTVRPPMTAAPRTPFPCLWRTTPRRKRRQSPPEILQRLLLPPGLSVLLTAPTEHPPIPRPEVPEPDAGTGKRQHLRFRGRRQKRCLSDIPGYRRAAETVFCRRGCVGKGGQRLADPSGYGTPLDQRFLVLCRVRQRRCHQPQQAGYPQRAGALRLLCSPVRPDGQQTACFLSLVPGQRQSRRISGSGFSLYIIVHFRDHQPAGVHSSRRRGGTALPAVGP